MLASHFKDNTILAGNSLFIDPVAAFITALLPVLKEKVNSILDQIPTGYLSRFISQILNFDEKLRKEFHYDAGNPGTGWKGLAWDVLDVWFDKWLKVEKDFAWNRYKQILTKEDETQLIDFDSGSPTSANKNTRATKSTFASLQVGDLLISVTTQYLKVRRFSQKMMFLIDIQAEIMDDYIKYLANTLDTFTQMAAVGRIAFSSEMLENIRGTNGLERLCRVYCSAEHLATLCKEWSNETVSFFHPTLSFSILCRDTQPTNSHSSSSASGTSSKHAPLRTTQTPISPARCRSLPSKTLRPPP